MRLPLLLLVLALAACVHHAEARPKNPCVTTDGRKLRSGEVAAAGCGGIGGFLGTAPPPRARPIDVTAAVTFMPKLNGTKLLANFTLSSSSYLPTIFKRIPTDKRFIYYLASLSAAPVATLCKAYLPGANVSISAVETSGDVFTLRVLSADAACTAGATANTPMELLVMDVDSKSVSLVLCGKPFSGGYTCPVYGFSPSSSVGGRIGRLPFPGRK